MPLADMCDSEEEKQLMEWPIDPSLIVKALQEEMRGFKKTRSLSSCSTKSR